jgi:cysteine desulfurase
MMLVNNETGAIYPVEEAAKAIKAAKSIALLHCDCIQAFLKIPFSPITLGADLLSVSSHKIHGPKGCGALYVRSKLSLPPYLYGGMQESGLRSGTENTPGICGFGEAAKLGFAHFSENAAKLKTLKEYAQNNLKSAFSEIVINSPEGSSPHILNFSLPGYRSETILHYLESRGIYVSSGSACKKGAKSHVLACMALPDNLIDSAIRLSFSDENTTEDIDSLICALSEGVKTLQKK